MNRFIGFAFTALAFFGVDNASHGANIFVGADSQCAYTSLAAAVTAATHTGGSRPTIYIAANMVYSDQAISISPDLQSTITLIGGIPHCGTTVVPNVKTTLTGGSSLPVITVRGAMTVSLSHLEITGGHGVNGGGIDYSGSGTLNIGNAEITANHGGKGGGIHFNGSGGNATLNLGTDTVIDNNSASDSGGGIRIDGSALLNVLQPQVWIYNNTATNYGGGIQVIGPANAELASPGYKVAEYAGLIYGNTAARGGGISINVDDDYDGGFVRLFTVDANNPVRIQNNRATSSGGGIYLQAKDDATGVEGDGGFLCAQDYRIDQNSAVEGAAIYADTDSGIDGSTGALVGLGTDDGSFVCTGYTPAEPSRVMCSSATCNLIDNNVAEDAQNNPTAGSTILIQTSGSFSASHLAFRNNAGAHVIRVADSLINSLRLDTCLIADNATSAQLLTFGSASASINQCTIADNTIAGSAVINAATGFSMTNSIVKQGALTTVAYSGSGGGIALDYIVSQETASLSAGTHLINADAKFVDETDGDYHLSIASPAIDVAPASATDTKDLEFLPRDVDVASVTNVDGPRDLGAYERQLSSCVVGDTIFCDGFEP